MLTVFFILAISAFVCTVVSAAKGWCPLWVAVLLLCVIELIRSVQMGH